MAPDFASILATAAAAEADVVRAREALVERYEELGHALVDACEYVEDTPLEVQAAQPVRHVHRAARDVEDAYDEALARWRTAHR